MMRIQTSRTQPYNTSHLLVSDWSTRIVGGTGYVFCNVFTTIYYFLHISEFFNILYLYIIYNTQAIYVNEYIYYL